MIGVGVNAARAIIPDLSGLRDFDAFGPDAVSLCASLTETIADPRFPGAVVPSIDLGGNLQILVVASTMCVAATQTSASSFRWPHAHLI